MGCACSQQSDDVEEVQATPTAEERGNRYAVDHGTVEYTEVNADDSDLVGTTTATPRRSSPEAGGKLSTLDELKLSPSPNGNTRTPQQGIFHGLDGIPNTDHAGLVLKLPGCT